MGLAHSQPLGYLEQEKGCSSAVTGGKRYCMETERTHLPPRKGFTLIELIVVLIILGLLAVVLGSRFISMDGGRLSASVTRIKTHFRYAQLQAMKHSQVWGIAITTTGYTLFQDTIATPRSFLGESPGGITFDDMGLADLSGFSSKTVYFDRYGIPYTDSTLTSKVADANTVRFTVELKSDNARNALVAITPETGFIP